MRRFIVLLLTASVVVFAGIAGQATGGATIVESDCTDVVKVAPQDDTFITSVFTLADIVIFSYYDSTSFRILNPEGAPIWSGQLNEGEHHAFFPGQGVFIIRGNHKYSVLVGDPLTDQVQGFYAVDQNNQGVSERFFTLQTSDWGGAQFIVFAYEDSTVGQIIDTRDDTVIDSFTLDSAGHYAMEAIWAPVEVTSNKGVSALSYGDQGYWVPAANGSFAGQLFYTYRGYIGDWPNDINVIAYYDDTQVKITNTLNQHLLWHGNLDDGEVYTLPGNAEPMYVTVEARQNVTCLVAPFESYTSSYARLYNGMDRSGRAIGKKFYHPTISDARMDLYSFYDDNHVYIFNQFTGAPVWDGVLDAYEYYTILSTSHTLYRIESDSGVALYDEMAERAGAIFAPMWYATFDPIEFIEEDDVSENEVRILSTIADDELVFSFDNFDGAQVKIELYDVSGRSVLSQSVYTSRVAFDVSTLARGVYFLSVNTGRGRFLKSIIIQ